MSNKEKEIEVIEHDSVQLTKFDQNTAPVPVTHSPLQQMIQAKEMGLSIDEMKDMMALQKEYEQNEARKAFHVALAEFKKNPPKIVNDKLNKQFDSSYTSIGNMVNTVNEAMGPFGLSSRWEFPETDDETIKCTCILSHTLGHEEKVTLLGRPDTSGSKNPLQERKSARTYLKLETFEAVTGMASVEGNIDDDGNSAGKKPSSISGYEVEKINKLISDNKLDMKIFMKWLKLESIACIPAEKFPKVIKKINETIDRNRKLDNK